ncbi:hypothetical protein EDM68_05615 [Candidatus Uhrbacteria bacterium]|nr:MAG: hypothetical protein EDM68_05615 [Candidatus Uhrbacteria bacterium]
MKDRFILFGARLVYGTLIWLGLMIFVSAFLSVFVPVEWATVEYGKGPSVPAESVPKQYYSTGESFQYYFYFSLVSAIFTPFVFFLPSIEWVYQPKVPVWWPWVSWAWIWIPVIAYLLKPAFKQGAKKR